MLPFPLIKSCLHSHTVCKFIHYMLEFSDVRSTSKDVSLTEANSRKYSNTLSQKSSGYPQLTWPALVMGWPGVNKHGYLSYAASQWAVRLHSLQMNGSQICLSCSGCNLCTSIGSAKKNRNHLKAVCWSVLVRVYTCSFKCWCNGTLYIS